MATRRRSSATKSAKTIVTPVKTSPTTVKKTQTIPATRVNNVTKPAEIVMTEETKDETTTKVSPDFTKLRGLDFVILPLIYLEAFVVNILTNAGLNVPERVAIK